MSEVGTANRKSVDTPTETLGFLRDQAIQATSQGILIADATLPDFPIIYVNRAFCELTGYTQEEVIGRNCRYLQGQDTDPKAKAMIRHALRAGRAISLELRNHRRDGSAFWNALSLSPILNQAGEVTHYVGVQTDVTARREMEAQFFQAQKMEAVGRLAAGVAHDFNNLLTIINGYSEMLMSQLPPEDASSRDFVDEIRKAGERASGLTQQLLAFSRKQILEPKVLDPNELIRDSLNMVARILGEDIELICELDPDIGMVRIDPAQFSQILLNLTVNSRDAMPQGGKLWVQTQAIRYDGNEPPELLARKPGRYVRLSVSDTGCGMSREVLGRIFEPFFSTKGSAGTGLGLAVVHGIVKQTGGQIEASSQVGIGTRFQIDLPVSVRNESDYRDSKADIDIHGSETLLLAEDETALRNMTERVLTQAGYRVIAAANAREALELMSVHSQSIALVITDVVMPGGNGRLLAEELRKTKPDLKVLYVSGYTDDAVLQRGVQLEEVAFLQKPYTPQSLAKKVREVLDSVKNPI